jgi:hypothetical protein
MYLADRINKRLDTLPELAQLRGSIVTPSALKAVVHKFLKPYGAKAVLKRDAELIKWKKHFTVSGEFLIGKRATPITIFLHIRPDVEEIDFTRLDFPKFRFFLAAILQHEIIHREHFARYPDYYSRRIHVDHSSLRSQKRRDEVEYLTDYSEVDAYAHDIAMELRYYYPNRSLSELLNNIDHLRKVHVFHMYKKAFRGLDWTVLRRTLLRKVHKWYNSANPPSRIVKIHKIRNSRNWSGLAQSGQSRDLRTGERGAILQTSIARS